MLLRKTLRCCSRSLYGMMMARFCRGTQSHGAQLPPDIVKYLLRRMLISSTSSSSRVKEKNFDEFIHCSMSNLQVADRFECSFSPKQFLRGTLKCSTASLYVRRNHGKFRGAIAVSSVIELSMGCANCRYFSHDLVTLFSLYFTRNVVEELRIQFSKIPFPNGIL